MFIVDAVPSCGAMLLGAAWSWDVIVNLLLVGGECFILWPNVCEFNDSFFSKCYRGDIGWFKNFGIRVNLLSANNSLVENIWLINKFKLIGAESCRASAEDIQEWASVFATGLLKAHNNTKLSALRNKYLTAKNSRVSDLLPNQVSILQKMAQSSRW